MKTTEELEALLETVNVERDDLKQRLLDMVLQRNDVRDKLDICGLDLVTAKRERDAACDDLAFVLAEYANERNEELTEDALCLKIAGLTHQRDDARTQLAMVEAWHKQMCSSAERGWAQEAERTRERDEARDEVEKLTAEVAMLRGVGCCESDKLDEPPSGPCGVCRKCAYRRGAEAMRTVCVTAWDELKSAEWETTGERLSALPIPEEPTNG